jgi:hypothetical protein
VLPKIPAKARTTVRGRALADASVAVDSSGRVIDAKLERGSRNFGAITKTAVHVEPLARGGDK